MRHIVDHRCVQNLFFLDPILTFLDREWRECYHGSLQLYGRYMWYYGAVLPPLVSRRTHRLRRHSTFGLLSKFCKGCFLCWFEYASICMHWCRHHPFVPCCREHGRYVWFLPTHHRQEESMICSERRAKNRMKRERERKSYIVRLERPECLRIIAAISLILRKIVVMQRVWVWGQFIRILWESKEHRFPAHKEWNSEIVWISFQCIRTCWLFII